MHYKHRTKDINVVILHEALSADDCHDNECDSVRYIVYKHTDGGPVWVQNKADFLRKYKAVGEKDV